MPDLGIGTVTAALEARGHGFNPMSRATRIDAHARIHRLTYRRSPVTGVTLDASLGNGNLTAALHSDAPAADLDIHEPHRRTRTRPLLLGSQRTDTPPQPARARTHRLRDERIALHSLHRMDSAARRLHRSHGRPYRQTGTKAV